MRQTLIYSLLALILSCNGSFAQQGTFVNRRYYRSSGNPVLNTPFSPYGLPYSKSIKTSTGYFITTGHSFTGASEDVYVICLDIDGNIIFEKVYDIIGANKNDYALDISEAPNGDFLICGATQTGGGSGYDEFVLRVNSIGTYISDNVKDGGNGFDDFAVGIKEVASGNILVAANRQVAGGMFDYWIIRYDPSLNFQSENFYDFTGLTDIAIGFIMDIGAGEAHIVGASASGLSSCDYALARFDINSLIFLGDVRTSLSGSLLDKALAFARDASNNTYITGSSWNGTNFQIKTVKINANFTIGWTKTFDPFGFENAGNTIQVDASGNIIVAGYVTKSNNTKQAVCIKYNGSTGNEMWSNPLMQSAENPSGNAVIKKIALSPSGDIYFLGSEKSAAGNYRVLIGKIKSSGVKGWQRNIGDNGTFNYSPLDINFEGGNISIVSIKDSIVSRYVTTTFNEFEMSKNVSTYGNAKFVKNQLIVRFLPTALNSAAIDNSIGTSIKEFGNLKDFMTSSAYASFTEALAGLCKEEIKAMKVFPGLKTNFTMSTDRLNQPVSVPDFWTTLLIEFPCSNQVLSANSIINSLTSVAAYSHPNYLCQLYAAPNDSLYNQQYSIHNGTVFPNSDVNSETAWTIYPRGGRESVRGGIFDVGIDWEHHEFNYDGINPSTSKIIDGYDFANSAPLKSESHGNAIDNIHATAIAGIIGAQRNNGRGIAGIAGGNSVTGSKGVSLYGLTLWDTGGTAWLANLTPMHYITYAMYYSCLPASQSTNIPGPGPDVNKYCYELNFQNHSWGLQPPPSDTGYYAYYIEDIKLFSEVSHSVNRFNVTSIAARGNNTGTVLSFPANYDDDWVLSVTGTGVNGQFAHTNSVPFSSSNCEFTSAWGGDIDLGAPCSGSLITTLSTPGATVLGNGSMYNSFGGTSAAAPHVAGAVGLLMSYMNDTTTSIPSNYNNLAPEDCEAILQLSATDTDSTGYDQLTGHGRLNIGKAMKLIEKPYHRLLHFDADINNSYSFSKHISTSPTWDTVQLVERYQSHSGSWFQPGKYVVKSYQVDITVNHNITILDTIIASWPRPSSAVTWPAVINGKLTPREKTKILTINNGAATTRGFVYQIKNSSGIPLGWWPLDTTFISAFSPYGKWTSYSVLTKNYGNPVGIKENKDNFNSISVFPNPTGGIQTLLINTQISDEVVVDVYDIMGRKIKNIYQGKSDSQEIVIYHDASNLTNSLYIYNIVINGVTTTRKFIKQ